MMEDIFDVIFYDQFAFGAILFAFISNTTTPNFLFGGCMRGLLLLSKAYKAFAPQTRRARISIYRKSDVHAH